MTDKQGSKHLVHMSIEAEDASDLTVLVRLFTVDDTTGARTLESTRIMLREDYERLRDKYAAKSVANLARERGEP